MHDTEDAANLVVIRTSSGTTLPVLQQVLSAIIILNQLQPPFIVVYVGILDGNDWLTYWLRDITSRQLLRGTRCRSGVPII